MDQSRPERAESVDLKMEERFDDLRKLSHQNQAAFRKFSTDFRYVPLGRVRADVIWDFLGLMSSLEQISLEWVKSSLELVKAAINEKEDRADANKTRLLAIMDSIDLLWVEVSKVVAGLKASQQDLIDRVQRLRE